MISTSPLLWILSVLSLAGLVAGIAGLWAAFGDWRASSRGMPERIFATYQMAIATLLGLENLVLLMLVIVALVTDPGDVRALGFRWALIVVAVAIAVSAVVSLVARIAVKRASERRR